MTVFIKKSRMFISIRFIVEIILVGNGLILFSRTDNINHSITYLKPQTTESLMNIIAPKRPGELSSEEVVDILIENSLFQLLLQFFCL